MERITLQEHFATLEDPRVERTKRHPSTFHHHDCIVRGDLRSRHVGGCGGVWQVETRLVGGVSGITQQYSLA